MTCPRCGAANREGAAYCDSCGEPLIPGAASRTVAPEPAKSRNPRSDGLVALMTLDWFLRFIIVAIIGVIAAVITASMGRYDYTAFFLLLAVIGGAGTAYMLRHNPLDR